MASTGAISYHCLCVLTVGVQEGGVQLSGQQRIRYVSEEFFEQSSHIVNAVLLIQLDVQPHVKILPQLRMRTRTKKEKGKRQMHMGQTGLVFP